MRLYLAGAQSDYRLLEGLHVPGLLISYLYLQNKSSRSANECLEWATKNKIPVFLDSGAFSAMTIGARIDNREYIEFCKANRGVFSVIAALDVIKDAESTLRNYLEMRDAGIDCVPTFHVAEPFDALKRLARETSYVAIGYAGNQGRSGRMLNCIRFTIACFTIARNVNPSVRLHGLGISSWRLGTYFPWESVDSTTWVMAAAHGDRIMRTPKGLTRVRSSLSRSQLIRINAECLIRNLR